MLFGKRNRVVKRILIVEDEPLIAFDNETMLADLGYEVVATLDSFDSAIEHLDKEEVHLILSDLRLSGTRTGLDLARAAKARGVAILFATGHELPDEASTLAIGCLTKPYNERTLKNALSSIDRHLSGKVVKKVPKGMQFFPGETA
ncbi:MAG TPA: response regulator [Sphingomicrobium sp.]|jgi:DNA-binding response OmpR family regulator|nr:response regulator [Sphingomicrobium sp.]